MDGEHKDRKLGVILSISEAAAARVLSVDVHLLRTLRGGGVVHPDGSSRGDTKEWDGEDIARAFCAIKLLPGAQYERRERVFTDYSGLTRKVNIALIKGDYKELMKTDEWKEVIKKAGKEGIIFIGTRFDVR